MSQELDNAIPSEPTQVLPAASHSENGGGPAADASLPDPLHALHATLERMDARIGQIESHLQPAAPAPQPQPPIFAGVQKVATGWFQLAAFAIIAIVVFLRLYALDSLQSEIYGDIALIFDYLVEIRAGQWPFHFTLSSGPLYHYMMMPVILITGSTYFGIKLTSVLVSLGVLAATYALAARLIDQRFGLLATLIAGVSSWLLVFSRLGNTQILVPLLTICALWLALRFVQSGGSANITACAVVCALGLYVYPQSFILAPVLGLTLLCLRWTGMKVGWHDLLLFALVALICALPFVWIVTRDPLNFFSGYIGGKLATQNTLVTTLAGNLARGMLALHIRGDSDFRSNPVNLPHLDVVSGFLFLGGVGFWLRPAQRRLSPLLLVPLLLVQVPSMLVLSQPGEIPSASRSLGAAPIIYIFVASGLWWLALLLRARRARWGAPALVGALLTAIILLNGQRYFQNYIEGLPYQNTPIGRILATYIDALPPDTQVYMVGCCWQDGMPEPNSLKYGAQRPDRIHVIEPATLSCDWLRLTAPPAVLIWGFQHALPVPQLEACKALLPGQLYVGHTALPAFYAAPLIHDPADGPAAAPSGSGEPLESTIIDMNGQTVRIGYSPLDIGEINNLFDGSVDTLIRGRAANPLVLDIQMAQPRSLSTISVMLATMPRAQIKVILTRENGEITSFLRDFSDLQGSPEVDLPIPNGPISTRRLRIEILDLMPRVEDVPHIHVRELHLR